MGHESVESINGKDALEIYTKESIDLSIVDVNMPEMDGMKFLHAVKKMDPDSVIIIMTGFPSADTILETIEDDGYTYIAKPLDLERLKDLVERGLATRGKRIKSLNHS